MPAPAGAGGDKALRAFIAIPLPAPCQAALGELQQRLCMQLPEVRWTRPETIHLTLVFLGAVSEENLEKITTVMLSVGLSFSPFDLTLRGIGAFPSWQYPRVVWAGIDPSAQLGALQSALGRELAGVGDMGTDRLYQPHLTLGRCRSGLRNAVPPRGRDGENLGRFSVDRLILYESRLQAAGAIHIPLKTQFLGRNGGADESALPAGV